MSSPKPNPGTPFSFLLNEHSGVPVYRQLMDQVHGALAAAKLKPGDQLPTIRQVAVDLAINPNTVTRAYREMEIRGLLETQQGTGTFIADQQPTTDSRTRNKQLEQLVTEMVARAGASGLTTNELIEALKKQSNQQAKGR
jgi:DNA-binding transcriptional regulator YhcF (GntR family)